MIVLGCLCLLGSVFAFLVRCAAAERDEEQRACAARGGHLVEKAAYKSDVRFCVSADGKFLE